MVGQDKSKVSPLNTKSLADSCSTESFANNRVNCSAQLPSNKKIEHDILGHAYALVSFAKKEGIEPGELLAKILASGRLILAECQTVQYNKDEYSVQEFSKEGSTSESSSSILNKTHYLKDPTDLTCFEDELKELVY